MTALAGADDASPAQPVMVQATVRRHDSQTDSGSVLLDDGQELPYDGAAFARSGLRFLRSGQRVRAWRSQDHITALTLVTLPLPPA